MSVTAQTPLQMITMMPLLHSADDDEAIADLVRRTERKAIALLVGMAICLIFVPALWLALSYGI